VAPPQYPLLDEDEEWSSTGRHAIVLPHRFVRYRRVMGTRRGARDAEGERPPKMGDPGYFPDHTTERRAEYRRTTPGQRVAEAIEVSRTATKLAVLAARRRAR
jgi:hypothetical protein